MSLNRILSIVFLIGSIILAYVLINGIKYDIDLEKRISQGEAKIIERLKLIREAEIVYQEVNGTYTSDWDKLISFIDTGKYYLTEKSEEIVTLEYGADSVIVTIDTIGVIPAKQRIFEETNYVLAGETGLFIEYLVEEGKNIVINQNVYTFTKEGRKLTYKASQEGTIVDITSKSSGEDVEKGEPLIELKKFKFNPNIDITQIPYVPGEKDTKFLIWADEVDKSGVFVDVIEVINPTPVDPSRKEDSEIRNRKPLRFGSRTDVTTSGNWE
ncbi:MAG: hypothetical protein AAF363_10500 [Bacteroidota bacterium]